MFRRCLRYFVNKYKDYFGFFGNVEYLRDFVQRVLWLIEGWSFLERVSCDGGFYVGGVGIGYVFYVVV